VAYGTHQPPSCPCPPPECGPGCKEAEHAGTQVRSGIVGKRSGKGEVHGRVRAGFALWPQPCEEFDIETATATTPVHAYRPHPGGEPVVLLTGAGYNASGWYPHVAAFAKHHPVYGVDMPGDPNPSVACAPLTPPTSCATWLDELLAQLSDRPAHLVGLSYGGWVAMNQALRAPGRVASITLLDLTRLDARFWWWFGVSGLATLTPMPVRRHLARWLDSPVMLERELMTLMWAGSRGYRMEPKFPDILTDDER
jgi:pimeloyl-ACP methyl ester carboxylesterase